MFDSNMYAERRKRLAEEVKSGLILILGNEESSMNFKDNVYPFRQDSNFLYFFGLDKPQLVAIIDIDENQTVLYGDEAGIDEIIWMGPQDSLVELATQVGVEKAAPPKQIEKVLKAALKKERPVHFLPPYRPENTIKLNHWLDIPIDQAAKKASKSLVKAVIKQLSVKSEEEVLEIEKAVNISGAMHVAAMKAARPGMKEAQLAGIVEGIALACESQLSFPVILTVNGQTLHNHYHGNIMEKGRLAIGDFGAETAMHYAGDITRTFPVDKTFTGRQKDIYNIVLDAQLSALDSLKPGLLYLDAHLLAAKKITEGLQALGLMTGDVEESVAQGAHALFFPHGLGHMMGLNVHDMEDLGEDLVGYTSKIKRSKQFGLKSLRLAKALEPGFVLTVEPGIYFIPELIDLWQKENKLSEFINYEKVNAYRDFGGIRIEDDVLITEDGHRILGRPIPKTVEEVEGLRGMG